jgi:uncharacterized damage-inducible protein DinB
MPQEKEPQGSPSELELLRSWYRYNSAVRRKYLQEIFEKIPEEERYKDRGASFPSIVDIFIHVIDAYRHWFIFTYEDRLLEFERLRGKKKYLKEDIEAEEEELETLLQEFLESLTQEDLGRWVPFTQGAFFGKIKLRDMMWHMIEEELQHRGELNALFWQLDIDPPIIGWNDDWKKQISVEEYQKLKAEDTRRSLHLK